MKVTKEDLGKWVETNSTVKEYKYGVLIDVFGWFKDSPNVINTTIYFPFDNHEIKRMNANDISRILDHIRYGFIMDEFHK